MQRIMPAAVLMLMACACQPALPSLPAATLNGAPATAANHPVRQTKLPVVLADDEALPTDPQALAAHFTALATAQQATTSSPNGAWQPISGDWQALAERIAPRIAVPEVDQSNPPTVLRYSVFTNGSQLCFRFFVFYLDEDLQHSWEDALYDKFRKVFYGSTIDIEPIEVLVDAQTHQLSGVAIKTGQNQAFFKRFVKESDWLTVPFERFGPEDLLDEHPRVGVSTWNHLHDMPSTLMARPYPPTLTAPIVPVVALDAVTASQWGFDRRGLNKLPFAKL